MTSGELAGGALASGKERHEVRVQDPAQERLRRWRMVLGGEQGADGTGCALSGRDAAMDAALTALYGGGG
jgi:hypothetical protein